MYNSYITNIKKGNNKILSNEIDEIIAETINNEFSDNKRNFTNNNIINNMNINYKIFYIKI